MIKRSSPPARGTRGRAGSPFEVAIGAPARGRLEVVSCHDISGDDRLTKLELPGEIGRIDGRPQLSIIPMTVLRGVRDETGNRLSIGVEFAERNRAETARAVAALAAKVRRRVPTGFSLIIDAGSLKVQDLLTSGRGEAGKPAARPLREVEMRVRYKLRGVSAALTSKPFPAYLHAGATIREGVENGRQFEEWCPPWDCHSHWHGDVFDPNTWWTSCHGPCPAPKDCRCNAGPGAPRGFKVCNGWVFCWCL